MTTVTKADGTQEEFKVGKLKGSLKRAGATPEEAREIAHHIEAELHDGIKTQAIYRHAFELLRQSEMPTAARYSLRRALFGLGPSGFPFEDFLARLFAAHGYSTKTRLVLEGNCAEHELDVGAWSDTHSMVVEAKFHARPGIKSDLQVAMYCYARYLDLKKQKICSADVCGVDDFYLITNTKFTKTAIRYGECVGLKLLAWDYPRKGNLHDLIKEAHIYPITVLSSLSQKQRKTLLDRNVIVCDDLLKKPGVLRHLHLSKRKTEAVLSEARQLCN